VFYGILTVMFSLYQGLLELRELVWMVIYSTVILK